MKYPLLVATVSFLLTACASNDVNVDVNNTPVSQSVLTAPVQGDAVNNPDTNKVITMEKIMSDPDWMGRFPTSWYWGDDSQSVFYKQKRQGSPIKDLFQKPLAKDGNGDKVTLSALHKVADTNAELNQAGTHEVYTFEGNIFVKELATQSIKQLTFTSAAESQAMFLTNGDIAYRTGNMFFTIDSQSNQIRELANLQMINTPGVSRSEQTYISKEQHKLIKYIAKKQRHADLRSKERDALRSENDTIPTSIFYFGDDKRVVQAKLSPNGEMLVVSVAKKNKSNKGDIMPNYVTAEATIDPVQARKRVSDNIKYSEQVYLLDLVNDAQYLLGYDSLPGFDEDVLASVKTDNYRRDGKVYKSEKSPRNIHLMSYHDSIKWHKDSNQVAVMMEAWDNKDRWIATIDFEHKKFVSQNRLHDNAWINWEFNDFGWFDNSETLYYQSEESGFGHLYVKPLDGNATALTSGNYEVRSLTLAKDESKFYFQANKTHPGIFEIYSVDVESSDITAITKLGGNNDYQLSPDETKLLIEHSTTTMPPELFVQDVKDMSSAKQITHTVSDEFLTMPWVAPSIVEVPSSHTEQGIFSRVYQGEAANSPEKGKAVMFVHGAGYLQNSHLGWSGYFREFMFHSLLIQEGYTVIDMDYRASKGYGRDWRTGIYRYMGKPEVEDMLDGVNWLAENANVDPERVGVYGGSYGGFLTLMALFKEPEAFQSGSALRLVADWTSYNHGYTANILNTPEDDKIAYERSSPIYYAEGLNKPLLINAPMVDDNVFFQDTVRLVQRLIELEKQNFETAIYPVEPHGFVQPSSWLNEYRRIFKLFEETL